MRTEINKVELRNLRIEDYQELKTSMIEAYPEMADNFWKEADIKNLLKLFPTCYDSR
jgi:hypothetical protein